MGKTIARGMLAWLLLGLIGALASAQTGYSRWSDPETWSGQLPEAGAVVVIPPGRRVLLDIDTPPLYSLSIHGELVFADERDLELTAGWILVMGPGSRLAVGSTTQPFTHRAVISLVHGSVGFAGCSDGDMAKGSQFLAAMNGGRIELHGASREKRAWTDLAAHAAAGDTRLWLAEEAGWQPGDKLALAPSGFDARHAELLQVVASGPGWVDIDPPLQHRRWGELQQMAGRALNQRAAVGLLSRNILLRGAGDGLAQGIGGHVMVMPGGHFEGSGIEFARMGQRGQRGRYPLHWHLLDRMGTPGAGQYLRDSSIHHSFHRAVVVHGTSGVRVENNVAFDIPSHAFVVAEDGDETGNQFIGNLGMLVRGLARADWAFPAGSIHHSIQNEGRPGVFWMKNPNNTLIGNRAAGSIGGNGFFFDGEYMGAPPLLPRPRMDAMVFEDNIAHSNGTGGHAISLYEGIATGHGLFFRQAVAPRGRSESTPRVRRFTGYKNGSANIWVETSDEIVEDSIVSDAIAGFDAKGALIRDVLVIGRSDNDIGGHARRHYGVFFNDSCAASMAIEDSRFVRVYDGAIVADDRFGFGNGCRSRGLQLIDSLPFIVHDGATGAWLDEDGTLSGRGVPTLISNTAINTLSEPRFEWNAVLTPAGVQVEPVSTPQVTLGVPLAHTAVGLPGQFSAFNLTPMVLGHSFAGGAGYRWRINGVAANYRVDRHRGERIDTRALPSGTGAGWHSLQVELLDAAGSVVASSETVPFLYEPQATRMRVVSPLDGQAVIQPFMLVFSGTQLQGAANLPDRHLRYRLSVDGQVWTERRVVDRFSVDGLARGWRQLRLEALRADGTPQGIAHELLVQVLNEGLDLIMADGFEAP